MARNYSLAALLLSLCLSRSLFAEAPVATAPAPPEQTERTAEQTVERAIGYLQTESAAWLNTRKCAACHHVPMALWSLSEAQRQGFTIDAKYVADTLEAALGSPQAMIAAKLFSDPADPPDPRPLGKGVKIGTAFMAVAARSMPTLSDGTKQSLRTIADDIISKQREDGSWEFFLSRPPINESETTDAAWLIMALEGETDANASEAQRAALEKARAWLAGVNLPDNLQDKVFKLLLAARAGKPREEMQPSIDELLALQRPDGGWGQKPEMPSDAYATGQTLYALALAGCTAEQPQIKRGIDLLVATQQPDGSWIMTSRSTPDGSPGSSKLLTPINCAAASWATLGLARLAPKAK